MKPSAIKMALHTIREANLPCFLWGPPGVGKSQVVDQFTKEADLQMRDVRAILLDPVDLRGLPHINGDNRAHWAVPDFLPRDGKGVLFLDELNVAAPMVQAACYQLVLDRQLGEYILPEGWTVIAAGNRASDRAVTHAMPAPLRNRFVHLDFEVDLDDWCNWALGAGSPKWHRPKAEKSTTGMRPEIVAFLRFRPALLHEFSDKTRDANAFPTPRTWEYLSRILATNPPLEIEHALTAGTVGPGASAEFIGFLRVYRDLPDMDLILKKPDKAPVPKEPAALYAVATAVAHRATAENFQNVVTYLCRLPEEFSVMAMRDAQTRVPKLASTTPFADWVTKHQHVLM